MLDPRNAPARSLSRTAARWSCLLALCACAVPPPAKPAASGLGALVDRYVGWPGQALACKVGELAILALRARAERELGPRFDIRRFHDVVLAGGSLPLGVLEDEVARFIAAEQAAPARRR
jgi:uncharacterized protein (DUF885 family)